MSGSRDLEGVHGNINEINLEFGVSQAAGVIAQILAGRWGAAREDEVALRVHGVFPLPMGF